MKDRSRSRRIRRIAIVSAVVVALAGMNGPAAYRFVSEEYHDYTINKPEYKADNGHWDVIDFPEEYRLNTIHAALLHTGKILLVAGSGNNQKNFDAKKFETRLWDPEKRTIKSIPTPVDLFCTGHTQLPNGNLLIAGGTQRYEKLKGDVTKAGGLMIVHNEDPDKPMTLPAGTRFSGRTNGKTFVSKDPVVIERAKKVFDEETGEFERNDPASAASTWRRSAAARSTRPAPRTTTGCRASPVPTRAMCTASRRNSPWTRRTSRESGTPMNSTRGPRSTSRSTR